MTNTPIWLLDVDGVLNMLPRGEDPEFAWPDVRYGRVLCPIDNKRHWITYAPALLARIRELHWSDAVEVRWLTAWGLGANLELRQFLQLPTFKVAGEPAPGRSLIPKTGERWWKLDCAQQVRADEPDRPIVWTDDHLRYDAAALAWLRENIGHVFGVTPDSTVGISPANLDVIEKFIATSPPAAVEEVA